MIQSPGELPPKGGRVRFQSADDRAIPYLSRYGFHIEFWSFGGDCIARRDFDLMGGVLAQEPPPPRFPIQII